MAELEYISVAGYGSTGSSAVVNLLEEVESCHVVGGEFRFIQDPDGLEDLCSNLTDSWGWVRSDAFIRRFIKYTNIIGRSPNYFRFGENADLLFNEKFFKYRDEFLSNIIDTTWNGYWFYHDFNERNAFEAFVEHCKRYLRKLGASKKYIRKITKKSDMYFVRHDADCYLHAKKFINSLFNELLGTATPRKVVLDQLILPYNRNKFNLLFDNLQQIVVDRDPRDVFLDARTYNAYPITDDISTFISFYESVHSKEKVNNDSALYIKFEDLIFNYEDVKDEVFNYLDIDEKTHSKPLSKFDPSLSVRNTETWKRKENKRFISDISLIEKELSEWCYDYK